MRLIRNLRHLNLVRAKASTGAVAFSLLNKFYYKIGWKMTSGIPVRVHCSHTLPMYLRAGTTDWITCEVTFLHDEYGFVPRLADDVKSILDLGANIGDSTRYFAQAFPDAKIVAVEPDEGNFAVCQKNVSLLPAKQRIGCFQCFIGATRGSAEIDRSEGEWSYRRAGVATGTKLVRVITMEDLLPEFGSRGVDLLKCDIEGGERDLFENCSGWINKVRYIVIETSPPYSVQMLEADLARNGARFKKLHHGVPDGYHELALLLQE